MEDATNEMRDLGIVLADQATRYVQVVDQLLLEVQLRTRDQGIHTPDEFRRRMDGEITQRFLSERMKNLPQAHAVGLFDTDGALLNTSRSPPPPRYSVADRDYFQYLRDHADSGVFVSAPGVGHSSGIMSIFLARRISAPDGGFLGVAVAPLDVEYLLDFYQSVSRERDIAVTLLRRDGLLLARYPMIAVQGRWMPIGSAWHKQVAAGGGTYRSPGYFSGTKSIVAANPLRDYPLVIDVSIHEEDVLANWRHQAMYTASAGVVLAGTVVTLLWMIARHVRRQEEHNIALSRTAEALRDSKDRLQDFAELASDWFWEQDAELRFTNVGLGAPIRAAGDLSYVGKLRWELNDTSRDPERWKKHQQDVLAHLPFRDFRYDRIGPDNRIHHVSISGMPVHDRSGAFAGYRGVGHDITAQIEAEQAVRQAKDRAERAEALLQDAIDSIDQGFVIYDADGRLVTWNDGYERLYPDDAPWLVPGMTFTELLRHGMVKGDFPDAIGREQEWLDTWLRRHQELVGEIEQPLRNGRWVLVTKRRMRSGGTSAMRIDITALKQTQAALRASEAHLERAQQMAGIGSWDLDIASGKFTWSKELLRIGGLPPDVQPSLENLLAEVHADDRPAVSEWLANLKTGKERDLIEFRITRPDGQARILRLDGRQAVEPDDATHHVVGTVQDVTERRLMQRQLVQAQKMEAIGNLTGGMAHDFNNMLGVVVGNLDLLMRLVKADVAAAELCGEALDGATRCTDLIQRLLAFAGRQSLNPLRTDVNALVNEMARLLGRTLGEAVTLKLDLDAALWSVMADQVQLESALINLATNARDAMPNGGQLDIVTRNAHLETDYAPLDADFAPGDYALIEISDTGTGVPPEIIGRIFEPFFTTKGPGKGSGLGLSMTFGFAKQTGGHLSVYSEPGLGTTFRLYLPRADNGETRIDIWPEAEPVVGGDETVLVVEDNAQLRRAAARQLVELGYRVREAEHAEAALEILTGSDHVDLLFTDIVMPGKIDGLNLARQATLLRSSIGVLLTSGFPGVRTPDQRIPDSRFRLLNKPYRHDELARAVREILDRNETPASDTAVRPTVTLDQNLPDGDRAVPTKQV